MNQEETEFNKVCDNIILNADSDPVIKASLQEINQEAFKRNVSVYEIMYEAVLRLRQLENEN